MNKQKEYDFTCNSKRTHFSGKFKRLVLLEYAKGKSPQEAFKALGYNICSSDKKYCAKLVHKWRNEMYKNRKILFCNFENINNKDLDFEINCLGSDDESDCIPEQIKDSLIN